MDRKVRGASPGRRVIPVLEATPDLRVRRGRKAPRERPACKVSEGTPVRRVFRVLKVIPARKVRLAPRVSKDRKALKVIRATQGFPAWRLLNLFIPSRRTFLSNVTQVVLITNDLLRLVITSSIV